MGAMSVDVTQRLGYDAAAYDAIDLPEITYSIAGVELRCRCWLAVGEGVLVLPSATEARLGRALHANVVLDPTAP